jgi:hypothetical protein
MPRKNQHNHRQSLGNPFPHLPLIQSQNDMNQEHQHEGSQNDDRSGESKE